jgi:hypothetical protein
MTQFITLPKRAKDMTGQRFGLVIVLGPIRNNKGKLRWLCLCDCGTINSSTGASLRQGLTKSCGCLHGIELGNRRRTHGKTGTPLYAVWKSMNHRCYLPSDTNYQKYGQRGIAVCDEWRESFQAFYDHVSVLDHFGEDGYSLDRIDNEMSYQPGNVRWATRHEQSVNKRSTHLITREGKTLALKEWCQLLDTNYNVVYQRIFKLKWPIERALTAPKVSGRGDSTMSQGLLFP